MVSKSTSSYALFSLHSHIVALPRLFIPHCLTHACSVTLPTRIRSARTVHVSSHNAMHL